MLTGWFSVWRITSVDKINTFDSQPKAYRPAVDSRRKITVRALNDCWLVIVIFSSSYVKKDGRRREGKRDGDSALAGLQHLLRAGGSSHIVVAVGSQAFWREQSKNRDKNKKVMYLISEGSVPSVHWSGVIFNLMIVSFILAGKTRYEHNSFRDMAPYQNLTTIWGEKKEKAFLHTSLHPFLGCV